jgi:hypothetical protein
VPLTVTVKVQVDVPVFTGRLSTAFVGVLVASCPVQLTVLVRASPVTGGGTTTDTVTEVIAVAVWAALSAEAYAEFVIVPDVPAVVVKVKVMWPPAARLRLEPIALVHVSVLPLTEHVALPVIPVPVRPIVAVLSVCPLPSVSTIVTPVAVRAPVFVTVTV